MRNGVRPAERFVDSNCVKMGRLPARHVDKREEKTKSLSTCIDRQQQSDGHKLSKPRVDSLDRIGFEAFGKCSA
jgi:hypothetical protein